MLYLHFFGTNRTNVPTIPSQFDFQSLVIMTVVRGGLSYRPYRRSPRAPLRGRSIKLRPAKSQKAKNRKRKGYVPLSLPDGSPLADGSPSHCACVTLRHCRQRSRAGVSTTDPFSIMEEKSDESQFYQNMTIYLKTRKMLSQWTKQMRWRIKKSLPSFVSYVDVEPYAVSRLQHN